ncbi:hypothetical protein D3C84_958290 [compost metagenome]
MIKGIALETRRVNDVTLCIRRHYRFKIKKYGITRDRSGRVEPAVFMLKNGAAILPVPFISNGLMRKPRRIVRTDKRRAERRQFDGDIGCTFDAS